MPAYSIKTQHRDRLYWDEFQYCAVFRQADINLIRGLDWAQFKRSLAFRHNWAQIQNRHQINEQQLTQTFDFFKHAPAKFKLTFSWEYCYVYTNEFAWIQSLPQECSYITHFTLSQAVADRPRDQVSLLNPTHKYRTWFREKAVTAEVRTRLLNWVQAQEPGEVKLSNSLNYWLNNTEVWGHSNKCWLQRHFFVEHNSPQYETMLNMIMPQMIRKTQPVSQRTK